MNDVATAIDRLSSFENLYVIATILELATGKEILPGTPNDAASIIDGIRVFIQSGALADWWGAGTGEGSPLGEIWDAISGAMDIVTAPISEAVGVPIDTSPIGFTPGTPPDWVDPGLVE